MRTSLKYSVPVLILGVSLLGSQLSLTAQNDLTYQHHKVFTSEAVSITDQLKLSKNPFDQHYLSYLNISTSEIETLDLALGESNEWHTLTPFDSIDLTRFHMFRIHDSETLDATFEYWVALSDWTGSLLTFQYHPSYFTMETEILPNKEITTIDGLNVANQFTDMNIRCKLSYDWDGVLLDSRMIYHEDNNLFWPNFTAYSTKLFGEFNESLKIMDLSFRDSIVVIENSDTLHYYSPSETTVMLDTRYADGSSVSGALVHEGHLKLLDAIASGEQVYRLFEITGSAFLNPGSATAEYIAPIDELHLVIAAYNAQGQVDWIKPVSTLVENMQNPGMYYGKLIVADDQLILNYRFLATLNNGQACGTLNILAGEEFIETYDLIPNGFFRSSANYISVIEIESGDDIKIFSLLNSSVPDEKVQFGNYSYDLDYFTESHIVLRRRSVVQFENYRSFKSLFPTNSVIEPVSNTNLRYNEFVILPSNGDEELDHFFINYEQNDPSSIFHAVNVVPYIDNSLIFTGRYTGPVNLLFPNANPNVVGIEAPLPPPYFHAFALFTERESLSSSHLDISQSWTLYPNPAISSCFLSAPQVVANTNFELYDHSGRLLKSGNLDESLNEINLTHLPSGLYVVRINEASGKSSSQKLVKL